MLNIFHRNRGRKNMLRLVKTKALDTMMYSRAVSKTYNAQDLNACALLVDGIIDNYLSQFFASVVMHGDALSIETIDFANCLKASLANVELMRNDPAYGMGIRNDANMALTREIDTIVADFGFKEVARAYPLCYTSADHIETLQKCGQHTLCRLAIYKKNRPMI